MKKIICFLSLLILMAASVLAKAEQAYQPIPPVQKPKVIHHFIQLIKENNIKAYQGLTWNKDQRYLQQEKKGEMRYYNLYIADVNNDGKEDYVLTRILQGSGSYSGIEAVFTPDVPDGKKLTVDPIKKIIQKGLGLQEAPTTCMNWYCYLAEPFITKHSGLIRMSFDNDPGKTAKVCTYLWQGDSFILSSGRYGGCIGSFNRPKLHLGE